MEKAKPKLLFIFNQLLFPCLMSGGDVKGHQVYTLVCQSKIFDPSVVTPSSSQNLFPQNPKNNVKVIGNPVGKPYLVNRFWVTLYYILRAFHTIPKIITRNFDSIYTTGDFFCNTFPAYIYKITHPKCRWNACVFHLNPKPSNRQNTYFNSLFSYIFQKVGIFFINSKADNVFLLNHQIRHQLVIQNFRPNMVVSGAGIDSSHILANTPKITSPQPHSLLFLGRICQTKGALDLPLILSKIKNIYPDTHLNMVGTPDMSILNKLKDSFNSLGLNSNYTLHNYVADKTKYRLIKESEVCIFPSYEEGWNISLFECLFLKRFSLVYKLNFYRPIFKTNLIQVPLGNKNQFSKTVVDYFINPSSFAKNISACHRISRQYQWRNVYNKELPFLF